MGLKAILHVRPVAKEDIISFYGKPCDKAVKGIVVESESGILGIAGVLHTAPLQAFSSMREELKNHPKYILLAARKMREILNSYDYPVYTQASENEDNSMRFLEYVGFKHLYQRIYQWPIK